MRVAVGREMNSNELNEPFVPGKAFALAWIAISIPVLWHTQPWSYELPVYSRVAAIIIYPFLATILLYCPVAFVKRMIYSGAEGLKVLRIFLSCVFGVLLIIMPSWILNDYEPTDSGLSFVVAVWAMWYLNVNLNK